MLYIVRASVWRTELKCDKSFAQWHMECRKSVSLGKTQCTQNKENSTRETLMISVIIDRAAAFVSRVLASLGNPPAPKPMQNEPPCHAHALTSVPPSWQVSRSRFVVERPDSKIVHLTDIPSTELVQCLFSAISNFSPHPSCAPTEAVTNTVNPNPRTCRTNMLTMHIRMRQSMYVASTSCGRFCRLLSSSCLGMK